MPFSRESSPVDAARTNVLKRKIEDSMRIGGRNTGDLVRLKCTRRRTIAPPQRHVDEALSAEEYILPDTEDEWFIWEKKMEAKRSKVKQKAIVSKPKTVGKVLGAGKHFMDAPAAKEPTPRPTPSPLGFTVVKRVSSSSKAAKSKPDSNRSTSSKTPSQQISISQDEDLVASEAHPSPPDDILQVEVIQGQMELNALPPISELPDIPVSVSSRSSRS